MRKLVDFNYIGEPKRNITREKCDEKMKVMSTSKRHMSYC